MVGQTARENRTGGSVSSRISLIFHCPARSSGSNSVVRIPHAPDPEAVNIGCAALFDLVRNELGKLGIGGGRGHTDYQWDILGLGGSLELQRGHMAGGVVDLSGQIAVRAVSVRSRGSGEPGYAIRFSRSTAGLWIWPRAI